eukprot:COSAG06_NODE_19663_length_828_cov_0.743484_1_plen_30_part_10
MHYDFAFFNVAPPTVIYPGVYALSLPDALQ